MSNVEDTNNSSDLSEFFSALSKEKKESRQKLEEQIAFLQHEILQMSHELYSQQKEVSVLKKQISNLEIKINDFDTENELNTVLENKKPPHY